ncbi:MAG: hypothetical protein ABSA32_09460 [Candidatus Acidiferrales bacterium]
MTTSGNVSGFRRATVSTRWRIAAVFALAAGCALALVAQGPPLSEPQIIGSIEGDDLLVQGAPNDAMVVRQGVTPLASGADITVRTGQALVQLADGGEIGVCAPAHFSVIQAGNSITLALDYGRVHPKLPPATNIVIFTPLIAATPIAIGQEQRDVTVGLAATGAMCVASSQGAVRIAQQLSDESVIVPEGGSVTLADGALAPAGAAAACACEVQLARNSAPAPPIENAPPVQSAETNESKGPVQPADSAQIGPPAPEAHTSSDEPIYQVFVPPLRFNANSPASTLDPSPEMILIVRHARVRPGAMFVGYVQAAAPPPAQSPARPAPAAAQPQQAANRGAAPQRPGIYKRVRDYLHNLFGNPS